jgi:phage baseplate assembly protein W
MPIPQVTRIDPRDLDKNIAIGVSLPFNAGGVFNSTYSTKDQIKSNIINLFLTKKGERIENPEFGTNINTLLFENINNDILSNLKQELYNSVNKFIPNITILNINITPEPDTNTIYIETQYKLNISGQQDSIIIQLQ